MSTINFVREFKLLMEEARKEYLGCRERMLWIALLYIANDRAAYNPQTQTYEWPDGFFQISHDELNLYANLNKKAVLEIRNFLKQKGYIDFVKGERNTGKPLYKINYLSLHTVEGENDPNNAPRTAPNTGPNRGPNSTPNTGPNRGPRKEPIGDNNKYNNNININPDGDHHTQGNDNGEPYPRARAGGYIGLDGEERPCRYDAAWITSARARGAVAQRLLDHFGGACEPGSNLYGFMVEQMEYGMPPELIEDAAAESSTSERLKAWLTVTAAQRGYTREDKEARRCARIAQEYPVLARMMVRDAPRALDEQEAEAL